MAEGEKRYKPIVGISIGDPNGIGPEIIMKTFTDSRLLDYCRPVIYGSGSLFAFQRKALDQKYFNYQQIKEVNRIHENKVFLLNAWNDDFFVEFGKPTFESGRIAYLSLDAAANDLVSGKIDALVTAPINKKNIQSADFDFPGHTEFLASKYEGNQPLMLLVSEDLKVGVVTGHIPVKDVAENLTKERVVDKLRVMSKTLRQDFGVSRPKIAVLGLNPHAGEEGLLGKEELEVIIPALEEARKDKLIAPGPFPADGFFGTCKYREVDAVLAMYHDQGLIPFKTLAFETGVNYTAGLPGIRTSPDHGTAFSIAGKNLADERSFREAVFLACKIFANRKEYDELTENPLKLRLVKEKEN